MCTRNSERESLRSIFFLNRFSSPQLSINQYAVLTIGCASIYRNAPPNWIVLTSHSPNPIHCETFLQWLLDKSPDFSGSHPFAGGFNCCYYFVAIYPVSWLYYVTIHIIFWGCKSLLTLQQVYLYVHIFSIHINICIYFLLKIVKLSPLSQHAVLLKSSWVSSRELKYYL